VSNGVSAATVLEASLKMAGLLSPKNSVVGSGPHTERGGKKPPTITDLPNRLNYWAISQYLT
jgi:hypothetical protein